MRGTCARPLVPVACVGLVLEQGLLLGTFVANFDQGPSPPSYPCPTRLSRILNCGGPSPAGARQPCRAASHQLVVLVTRAPLFPWCIYYVYLQYARHNRLHACIYSQDKACMDPPPPLRGGKTKFVSIPSPWPGGWSPMGGSGRGMGTTTHSRAPGHAPVHSFGATLAPMLLDAHAGCIEEHGLQRV